MSNSALAKSILEKSINESFAYRGKIQQRFYRGLIALEKIQYSNKPENAPDFSILGYEKGEYFEFGAGWLKKTRDGQDFITLTFDDNINPVVYATAWVDNSKPDTFEIDFRRKRSEEKKAA